MNLLSIQQHIQELMAAFVTQAEAAAATGKTDLNKVAETILIPLFGVVYGYTHLENLNKKAMNYPGIDLGGEVARVAFQITASTDSEKIKDTLRTFVKYKLYEKYDRLIIYIITRKQKSYSGSGFDDIIDGKFVFDKGRDILDFRDVLVEVNSFQIDKARKVENILEANFGKKRVPLFGQEYEPSIEKVFLNLLQVTFPDVLYTADVQLDMGDDDTDNRSPYRRRGRKPRGFQSKRDKIRSALEQMGLRFAADWEFHDGKIITFHDLDDESLSLRKVIDEGTIEPLSPREYYSVDDNYEGAFKSLLRRCLQQKLYHRNVVWQHELGLFIFSEVNDNPVRKESWDKNPGGREVYVRTMKNNKPDEIFSCKHLAFQVQFRRISDIWYVAVTPDWFFSYDKYHKSFYSAEKLKWLKRKENNSHVALQAQFIAYFLKHDPASDIFESRQPYPFLGFGEFVTFDDAPYLDDRAWRPDKQDDDEDTQLAFDL